MKRKLIELGVTTVCFCLLLGIAHLVSMAGWHLYVFLEGDNVVYGRDVAMLAFSNFVLGLWLSMTMGDSVMNHFFPHRKQP